MWRSLLEIVVNKLYRRLGGIGLALIMIPAFIGLLACMPVPIGDPERSKIDDDLTGVWIGAVDDEVNLFFYEPYDKRTWLVRQYEVGGSYDKPAIELSYEEAIAAVDTEDFDGDEFVVYKAWRTKLGKHWFVVWEIMGEVPGYKLTTGEGKFWYVWRIEKLGAGRIRMYMVDSDYDGFEDIEGFDSDDEDRNLRKLRRAAEKVIKRNIDDPDLYQYYEDDDSFVMFRLTSEDFDSL